MTATGTELVQLPEAVWRRLPRRPMADLRTGLEAARDALRTPNTSLPKEQP